MVNHSPTVDRSSEVAVDTRFSLDEAEFRRFYDATAHPLRTYLTQVSGDASLADNLAQEAYCRFLEVLEPPPDLDDRRRYVFWIATNLFHAHCRPREIPLWVEEAVPVDRSTRRKRPAQLTYRPPHTS